MKIGLFGDSYIDLIWHRHPDHTPAPEDVPWSGRLLKDMGSPVVSSGLGGASQFYAIDTWHNTTKDLDVAIFTFTWHERMFSELENFQEILSSHAERRRPTIEDANTDDILTGMDLYYRYLRSPKQEMFNYTQQVRYCLELPKAYPDIKFIFLPNTEIARGIAKSWFNITHSGVLVDFAFETLSNREPASPGPMPIWCGRYGHLGDCNHELVKNMVKDIIINYDKYNGKVYSIDYKNFDTI